MARKVANGCCHRPRLSATATIEQTEMLSRGASLRVNEQEQEQRTQWSRLWSHRRHRRGHPAKEVRRLLAIMRDPREQLCSMCSRADKVAASFRNLRLSGILATDGSTDEFLTAIPQDGEGDRSTDPKSVDSVVVPTGT